MAYQEFEASLQVEYPQEPLLPATPASLPLDLTALLRDAGLRALPDLSSLRAHAGNDPIPAQFSPADDFDAATRCAGTLELLVPRRDGRRLECRLRFGATDDLSAPRLPYRPGSYRRMLPDGRAQPPAYFRRMQLIPQPGHRLDVEDDGKRVTSYHFHPEEPKPYLFPLIGPAGRGLTRLGHPHDPKETHSHHHSVWVGFQKVNEENFWEERQGGRLLHREFPRLEDGPVRARFVSLVHWSTQAGKRVLTEHRDVSVYAGDASRLLDFTLRFQPAEGAGAVTLGQTSFGFLAVRVAKSMGVFDGGGLISNSEGGINEPGIFHKPARWCDYSGPVTEERWNGIGFLDHPENPHHPTPWHVRPDGWMGAAFATHQGHAVSAERPLELRYRLYLHDGDAREARVERAWHDFAHPPRLSLGRLRERVGVRQDERG